MTNILAVTIGIVGALFIAAEEALPGWAQYGILGLIIIALVVTKQLVPGWVHADTIAELKEVKAENKQLVQTIIDDKAVTGAALIKSSEMLERTLELHRRNSP